MSIPLDISRLEGPRLGDLSSLEKVMFWADLAERVAEALRPASEAVEEFERGDERPLRDLTRGFLGHKPDPLLMNALRGSLTQALELHDSEDVPIPGLYNFLKHHRIRLSRPDEAALVEEESRRVRRGIKRFEKLDKALGRLALGGQGHEDALRERIPGLAYEDPRPGYAANEVCREAFERTEVFDVIPREEVPERRRDLNPRRRRDVVDEKKLMYLHPFELTARSVEDQQLVALVQRDDLQRLMSGADLSPQEAESFVLSVTLGNQAAATKLGRPVNQVRQERFRAIKKLRRVA